MENKIQKNINLAPMTTFKIGGEAKFFIEVKTKEELEQAFAWAKKHEEKVFILGGGSNLLINSNGVDGLVLKIAYDEINVRGERIDCGAGANLARTVRLSISNNLSGLEWAVGIPGASVGGSILGNAGAFGVNISDIVETVEAYNISKERFDFFSNKDCEFSYRSSLFKEKDNYLLWNIVLKLKTGKTEEINDLINNNLQARNKNQPKLPNAGCIFKNLFFEDIKKNNEKLAEYAMEKGVVKGGKIGAGWLIDLADLKGKTIGGAKISLEHANFIVNTNKATSEDVMMLISYIKQKIRGRFKVQLQEEVRYLGF